MTLETILNQQIANWNVLYTKLHNFHWYVKGRDFFILHAKFEELYDEAAGTIDELAERLLMIGGKPLASMKQFLENATLKETTEALTAEEMVQNIVSDYETIIVDLKKGIKVAEENNDDVTADQFIGLIAKLDKHNWMLKSFLGT
jgi:starvation-inducible DNA-binding protein